MNSENLRDISDEVSNRFDRQSGTVGKEAECREKKSWALVRIF